MADCAVNALQYEAIDVAEPLKAFAGFGDSLK